ncbi:MAG TPA: hypothetical protein GXZ43_04330 [Clostridiaceae bacterium]|nr:hypothetical protein [Clostridiaceae bacterium]
MSSCSLFIDKNKDKNDVDQNNQDINSESDSGTIKSKENLTGSDSASSVLRVYWQEREDYNPLNTFDASGRAAYQLMHRSIFKINKSNVLTMDLARSASYIPDKNLYHIELIPGITFSDGTLLTANDCAASILQYKTNLMKYIDEEKSITVNPENEQESEQESTENSEYKTDNSLSEIMQKYPDLLPSNNNLLTDKTDSLLNSGILNNEFRLLSLIDEVEVIDEQIIEISLLDPNDDSEEKTTVDDNEQLSENDENLIDTNENLEDTNEIIDENSGETADAADNETTEDSIYYATDPGVLFALTMPIIPENLAASTNLPTITSANYSIESNDKGNIFLSATDSNFSLQKIQLIPYGDIKSAMTDLIGNKLDLIYLNEHNYNLFSKQNNVNIFSFPGQRYFYLSFGNGETVNIPEIRNAVINVWDVRDDLTSSLTEDQSSNQLPLQYNDQAISIFNLFEQQSDSLDVQTVHEFNSREIELKVLVPDRTLERNWGYDLREKLIGVNIKLELEYIDPDFYQISLEQGDYDLAFNSVDIPYPMSIFDAFKLINPSVMENLTESELQLFQEMNSYFYSVERQIDPKILNEKNKTYRDFINQKFSELDILGIGFAPVGILLSNNIEGSSESHLAEPYSGLEDLWVWQ